MASFPSSATMGGARKHACTNTPGTRGWSRLRNRTLAVQKKRAKISFFLLLLTHFGETPMREFFSSIKADFRVFFPAQPAFGCEAWTNP